MCANCHVVSIDVKLTDLEAIRRAVKRMGWTFNEDQTTYNWNDYWVDDSPVPRNLFETEEEYKAVVAMSYEGRCSVMNAKLGHCTHALKVPGANYEIGLIQRGNEYIPIFDWVHYGGLKALNQNGMNGFVQAYTIEKAKLDAQRRGYSVSENWQGNTCKLKVRVP